MIVLSPLQQVYRLGQLTIRLLFDNGRRISEGDGSDTAGAMRKTPGNRYAFCPSTHLLSNRACSTTLV